MNSDEQPTQASLESVAHISMPPDDLVVLPRDVDIRRRYTEGQTQTQIAQALGINQSTVSRSLQSTDDTREMAKLIAHKAAEKLMRRVLRDADVSESLEVLDRIEALPKRERESSKTSVMVNVGVNL